jgi:hypothetical protein
MWITVATPPFDSIETFDEVRAEVGSEPAGLEARYVGRADDGKLRSITIWRSKEDADRFYAETLRPALAKVLGPERVGPAERTDIEVQRTYTREPVS